MPRRKSSAGPRPPDPPPDVLPALVGSLLALPEMRDLFVAPLFERTLVPARTPEPGPPMDETPPSPGGDPTTADADPQGCPTPAAAERHRGHLAMFLLETLGGALTLLPESRPWDTRRCLGLLCRLASQGRPPTLPWQQVLALPTAELVDVVERARTAHALEAAGAP